jgi:hypothetical protein
VLPTVDNFGEDAMDKNTNSPQNLDEVVRQTLDGLSVIRKSLLAMETQGADLNRPADSLLDLELAAELKSVVDGMRKLLWAYVQTLSRKSGRRPEEVLEWYKMQLAVEMLRQARSRPSAAQQPRFAPRYTFDDLVTSALEVTTQYR